MSKHRFRVHKGRVMREGSPDAMSASSLATTLNCLSKERDEFKAQLAEVTAENKRLKEENDDLHTRYHLLSTELVYEGNSVQYWRDKALAYKACAGFVGEVRQLLQDFDAARAGQEESHDPRK